MRHCARHIIFGSLTVFVAFSAAADRAVFRSVSMEEMGDTSRVINGDFESGTTSALPGWVKWGTGYEVDAVGGRNGSRGVRCASEDPAKEYGVSQTVVLNQRAPLPILASGWSKAENVDGGPDADYSLYLDIMLEDGTSLWAQTAAFSTGTHDWERRTRIVTPAKPIRSVTVYELFRHHRGTACFDDVALCEVSGETALFEGGIIRAGEATAPGASDVPSAIDTGDGLRIRISPESGMLREVSLDGQAIGMDAPLVFVRDVAAAGDFVTADTCVATEAAGFAGECAGLHLSATCGVSGGTIAIDAAVTDLRKMDRAITVYVGIPVKNGDWKWWDDPRNGRAAVKGVFTKERYSGAGATGTRSPYPIAVLTGTAGGLAMAVPLEEPRHVRLGYNADQGLLFAAFDMGLSQDMKASPGTAACHVRIFRTNPEWGFRAGLARYYALFPEAFAKRVQTEGLWMAFTHIGSVKGWANFGFAYHEGTENVAWDEANGIQSFVYVEPMTTWIAFPPEVPRTYDGAMEHLERLCASGDALASKTRLSGVRGPTGRYTLSLENAPWCNGAVYALNAEPNIPPSEQNTVSQGQFALRQIESAIAGSRRETLDGWRILGEPYAVDRDIHSEGGQSIRVSAAREGGQTGAAQGVRLHQQVAEPLLLRACIRRSDVTGAQDSDCGVYVDFDYADGTPLYAQTICIPPGTGGFTTMERMVQPEKPLAAAQVYLLMRGNHTGTVWFDEVYLGSADGTTNLLANPGGEGKSDTPAGIGGAYLDSYEFWGTSIDYERAHFAGAELPLVFDPNTRQLGILTVFATFEFERELAKRMHAQGKLMMANGVLHDFDFPAAYLDVLGTETNWFPQGTWSPMPDEALLYKRALSYQKPYCFLLNTHYASLTVDDIERYIARCVCYGMYPGFFSENAATECFFAHPEWYEPARSLFKKYMPVIRAIAAAGWEPVTLACVSDTRLRVERFGAVSDSAVYLTLLNDSPDPVHASVRTDGKALELTQGKTALVDILSGATVETVKEGDALVFPVSLAPYACQVIRIERR